MLRARPSGPQWLNRSRHCAYRDVLGFLRSARVRILQHRTSASSEEEQQTVGADVPGDARSPEKMTGDSASRTYELYSISWLSVVLTSHVSSNAHFMKKMSPIFKLV